MRLIFIVLMISVTGLVTTLIAQDSSAVQSSKKTITHGYRFVDNNGAAITITRLIMTATGYPTV